MREIYLNPQAEQDLTEIFEYTFSSLGLTQAELYQDQLYEGMRIILDNAEIGEIFKFENREYRKLKINKHLLFYKNESEKCIVVRVLHEKMDFETKFWKYDH